MTRATCKGIAIEYESFGEGEPLLLEMGLGGQLVAWPMDWVNLLVEQGFRVIRYDNRDVGLSIEDGGEGARVRPHGRRRRVAAIRQVVVPHQRHGRRCRRPARLPGDRAGPRRRRVDGRDDRPVAWRSNTPSKVSSLTSIMSNTGDRRYGRVHPKLLTKAPQVAVQDS